MKFEYSIGATPLDPDEMEGLVPLHITTQGQLNEWEAVNILKAENWLFSRSIIKDFLTIDFIKRLHKKMFNETWKWAGKFRISEKNIGVSPFNIATNINHLLEDARYQLDHGSFEVDEIAYRFHHRLVAIHPFPNGNGRHARLMTDVLLTQIGYTRFTWGSQKLETEGLARGQYISALREADKHDYTALAAFVRS
jgi:Fic-DOC domain mobile mystery protein B